MPEAIDTKKRRFARALDSFTSGSSTSLTPSLSTSATSAKRPLTAAAAFDEARERASKRLRQSTSSSSLPRSVISSSAGPRKDDARSKDPPNFAPWSHEAFLARLKTFSSVSQWHPKPEAISEVEWAKRGWVCVDINTVGCKGGCERRVVVSLELAKRAASQLSEEDAAVDQDDGEEEAEQAAFEQALAERYKDVIVDGHTESCLWRKAGCKDDIYHLQVVRPAIWQPELRRRFRSVSGISTAIDKVRMKPLDKTDANVSTTERLLTDLPAEVLGELTTHEASPLTKALDVALHGWRGSTDSGSELLHCDACFQRIGLWMYQPDYRSTRLGANDDDAEDAIVIDLVEMHREHCPWRNASSQKASGSLSGMNASEILQRVVSTCARESRRRSDERTSARYNGSRQEDAVATETVVDPPVFSREETARQDKERESRLRKLKSLFSIKRRSTKTVPKASS